MLLATDLDGTFLAGTPAQKQELYSFISAHDDVTLAYVTGRNFETVRPLLDDPDIAKPDYFICDVGATILDKYHSALEPIQSEIAAKWPGDARVKEAMSHFPDLVLQQTPQSRRCSYFCESVAIDDALLETVSKLGCELLFSASCYLDVLPAGVHKGSTLSQCVKHLGIDPEGVLVAGDTLNDLSLFEQGFKGVCVGESEPALLEATQGFSHVLHASQPGCGGILEAIHYFSLT